MDQAAIRRGFILVTRPRADAPRTAAALRRRGLRPLCAPALTVELLDRPPPAMARIDGLVVSSANAVRALTSRGGPGGMALGPAALTLAVGDRTAEAARRAGLPNPLSAGADARALAGLCAERLPPGASVLQLAGEGLGLALTDELRRLGHAVARWETYRTVHARRLDMAARWLIGRRRASGTLLLSPRSASGFARLLSRHDLWTRGRELRFACISQATAQSLLDSAPPNRLLNLCIAQRPDLGHTIDALLAHRAGPEFRRRSASA